MSRNLQITTLGGGCFWCVEAVFKSLKGVEKVVPGYAGGKTENPTYEQVCSGETGHAEVIRITFDAATISFSELLYVFWRAHDPTTLNRQGADTGTQYRSIIFYHNAEQQACADKSKIETGAGGLWPEPIVTKISPIRDFYAAEDYHQDYFALNPNQPYCRAVIDPKVQKLRKALSEMLK